MARVQARPSTRSSAGPVSVFQFAPVPGDGSVGSTQSASAGAVAGDTRTDATPIARCVFRDEHAADRERSNENDHGDGASDSVHARSDVPHAARVPPVQDDTPRHSVDADDGCSV